MLDTHNKCLTLDDPDNICYVNSIPFFNFWSTSFPFVGPLTPLFWTSSDVWPGFQNQGGSHHLHATESSDSPLVQHLLVLLAASMAAKPFSLTYLWTSIGGTWGWDLSCMPWPHSVRPGRNSTDWAVLARHITYFVLQYLIHSSWTSLTLNLSSEKNATKSMFQSHLSKT